ncbi:hypothetical protein ALO97_101294 [Pseudomonas syringae pv. tagetis]|nr:hypothetical protein ALO97_101294 [Pseudomonas syringae pv. tagetis]
MVFLHLHGIKSGSETLKNKNPQRVSDEGFWNSILTMTYSHMGKPHTTIGDTSFHC